MRAWLFAGQGSQRKGMGAALFERYPDQVRIASDVLGYDVAQLCRDDPDGRLGQTRFAQPAIFVIDVLSWLAAREEEPEPDYLAGHSLGEIAALHAAGCFDFGTGVRLVRRRGELMGQARGGGMLAVVDLEFSAVTGLLAELSAAGGDLVDVANRNSPTQFVLSGPDDALRAIGAEIRRRREGRAVPLSVSAAFHSRYMTAAAEQFEHTLRETVLRPPRIPVVANVTARPYQQDVAGLLHRQVVSPVRWSDSMHWLRSQGVDQVREIGPGNVLTGLWRAAGATADPVAPAPRRPAPAARPVAAPPRPRPKAVAGPAERSPGQLLGSAEFRREYGLRYAYLAGSMFRGISSVDLVARMAEAGLMGFFGTGGLSLKEIEEAIIALRDRLAGLPYGMNLLHELDDPELERQLVELYRRHGVRTVEAAGFTHVTPAIVSYRFAGARRGPDGVPVVPNRVLAKVSRPEIAAAFMRPAPANVCDQLIRDGALTEAEAAIARDFPLSGDVCVEADSGGHTDAGVALTLLPAMTRLRDDVMREFGYPVRIRVGASGGLGAPEALAAAFVLGADFVVTGSVNQCSPQAGTSDTVKELLAQLDVQDTAYAPAGDMFELGARVQVVRRGTMFAARGNKLYQLYRTLDSLDELDEQTRTSLEEGCFKRPLARVWQETSDYYRGTGRPEVVGKAERVPKHKMALVFKWYFAHSINQAFAGDVADRANFQIHCGPAMGAFNRFARGTDLADWHDRDVDRIAEALMEGAAVVLAGTRTAT